MKQLIPKALTVNNSRIRTAGAMVIAAIGLTDFPQKWPSLLNDLVSCLGSPNPALVQGAIKTLDFLATSKMADDQVPHFLQTVFPALHKVFHSSHFNEAIKSRAASIVYGLVQWVGVLAAQNQKAYTGIITQSMQMWMDGFLSVLRTRDSPEASSQLKIKVVTIITAYAHNFSKLFRPYAGKCAEAVWTNIIQDAALFERCCVFSDDIDTQDKDSDGNVMGFELLIASYFEFIHALSTKKSFKELITKTYGPLIHASVTYLQLTYAQAEQFAADPNEFVAAEENEFGFSIRTSCVELLQFLTSVYRADCCKLLLQVTQAKLSEAEQRRQGGHKLWWRLREAALFAMGSVSTDLHKYENLFNQDQFIRAILPDVTCDNPFLRNRALWVISQNTEGLNTELGVSICQTALRLLNSKSEQLPVKFSCCKTIALLASSLPEENVYPALGPSIMACAEIFPACTEDTIPSALETMEMLLGVSKRAMVESSGLVVQQLIQVWRVYANNESAVELVVDMFGQLSLEPQVMPVMSKLLLPVIVSILSDKSSEYFAVNTAIECVAFIVRNAPSCLSQSGFAQLFMKIISIAMTTDELALMQSTSKALLAFVSSNGASGALASFNDPGTNQSGVHLVLGVVRRLLDPNVDDDGAMYVGKLILKMIQLVSATGSVVPQILNASLPRLAKTSSHSLIQSLILVFARLIHLNPQLTMDFLMSTKIPDGSSALAFVMKIWLEYQTSFYGSFQTKVTVLALLKLFQMNNAQVNSVKVKGPEIVSQGRSTRSKGPIRYAEITLQQKIFEIVVETFVDKTMEAEPEGEDDQFSSEDDDLNLDGSEFDGIVERGGGGRGKFMESLNAMFKGLEEGDADDEEEDPDFLDDPINKVDLVVVLREFLYNLMQMNQKLFEAGINSCPSETGEYFRKTWGDQIKLVKK